MTAFYKKEQSKKRYEENREEKLDKCKKYRDTHKEEKEKACLDHRL